MKKVKKAHQSDVVSFELVSEDPKNLGWVITHPIYENVYVFSQNNIWTLDRKDERLFASLHAAVNYANRRGFNILDVPYYECNLDDNNNILHVILNGKEIATHEDIKSEKQISDIMKENYAVNLSKMDDLI